MVKSAKWMLIAGMVGSSLALAHGHKEEMKGQGGAGTAGQSEAMAPMGQMDRVNVLDKIHLINQEEIQLGQLAQQHAMSKDVKKYAEHLMKDHQDADRKLMDLTRKEKLTLSMVDMNKPELKSMQDDAKANMDKLQGLQGAEFDREFLTTMVQGHDKAIALASEAEMALKNDPVGKFAKDLTPKLKTHRNDAQKLLDKEMKAPAKARHAPPTTR